MKQQMNGQMNESDIIIDMEPLMMAQAQTKNANNELAETQSIRRIIWMIAIITLAVTALFIGCNNYYHQSNAMQRTLQAADVQVHDARMKVEMVAELREMAEKKAETMSCKYVRDIGRGLQAAVFEVTLDESGQTAAFKVRKNIKIHQSRVNGAFLKRRFENEINNQTAASEIGAFVLGIHNHFINEDEHCSFCYSFILTDLINGEDCEQRSREQRMTKEEIVDLILDGFDFFSKYARAGYAHLDVKPANIMMRTEDGKARLIDFDLSQKLADEFNKNPQQTTTPQFRSGLAHYAKTMGYRSKILEAKRPDEVHDFIAFLNTILDIVNYNYDLGFTHCNWLRWFEENAGKKDAYWAKNARQCGSGNNN